MRLRIVLLLLMGLFPAIGMAQNPEGNYNPYVNEGMISPSPLWPYEENGTGVVSFNIGNSGSDALEIFTDQYITLTVTLSYGEPDHADPLSAVAGSSVDLFSWSYSSGTYTAIQTSPIPANSSGTITIAYKVTQNSSSPGSNGFNVNITPAPYQTNSNTQNDDAVSSYTYTEIRDYGDAPGSYGTAYHILDFENYLGSALDGETSNQASSAADGDDSSGQDDEDGVTFPSLIKQGESINISIQVHSLGGWLNAWIDWNGDGDFNDTGEQIANNVARSNGTNDIIVTVPSGSTSSATFARFRFSPGTLSSSSGSASGGEVEDYRITIATSSQAPSVPTGLKVNSVSEHAVSISWNASTDNTGVSGYKIYRGGYYFGTSTGLAYTDGTVSAGNSYTYSVSAYNAAGFESAQSSTVTVYIDDITPPTVPTGLNVTTSSVNSVSLAWNTATDNVGVSGYRIYRGGEYLGTSSGLSYQDNTVSVGNSYIYTVSAIDAAGNESARSSGVTANTNDTTPPTIPTGLKVNSVTDISVSLSWIASTDNVSVTGYRIYRLGVLHETVAGLTFTDNSVSTGITYIYTVSAIDESGNESAQSSGVSANIKDTVIFNDDIPPTTPTGFKITSATEDYVSLSWNVSTDNVGVAGYRIYREGSLIGTSSGLTHLDSTITAGRFYTYTVSAVDMVGNESEKTSILAIYIDDTSPPTVPLGLICTSASSSAVSLSWSASVDNVAVSGYNIYRSGIFLETIPFLNYKDSTVIGGTSYIYSVSAVDDSGNESEQSDSLAIIATLMINTLVSKMSVFPNPSKGQFFIDLNGLSGRFNLEIVSSTGVPVAHKVIELTEFDIALDLDDLNNGIYFIRIFNKGSSNFSKMVIFK